jgi:pimeloyl-ACP methyl ester carboxylesterase
VRRALGYGPVNLFGVSYGTRLALEVQRQFPGGVRRMVLDGVAPPDMALPLAMSADAQSALEALFADCEREPGCARRYAGLRVQWRTLLASLPRQVTAVHPVTGREERVLLTRDMLTGLVRAPLYVPALASGLPLAISEAAQGRYAALLGLGAGGAGGRGLDLAMGMHFSVICAEDMPRLALSAEQQGADFGESALRLYRQVCAGWPRTTMPPAFYTVPAAQTPVLLLSGAIDPATPPRHAERVREALGPLALHVVVPQTGHGVLANVACLREAVVRFVDAESAAEALARARADANCAALLPRPLAFQAVGSDGPRSPLP